MHFINWFCKLKGKKQTKKKTQNRYNVISLIHLPVFKSYFVIVARKCSFLYCSVLVLILKFVSDNWPNQVKRNCGIFKCTTITLLFLLKKIAKEIYKFKMQRLSNKWPSYPAVKKLFANFQMGHFETHNAAQEGYQ